MAAHILVEKEVLQALAEGGIVGNYATFAEPRARRGDTRCCDLPCFGEIAADPKGCVSYPAPLGMFSKCYIH
jgi:hypothetical protein